MIRIRRRVPEPGIRVMLQSLRAYWVLIALAIAWSLGAAVFEGIGLGLLIPFLQSLSDTAQGSFRTGWHWIDHWLLAINAPQMERVYRICGFILVTAWFRSGFNYLSAYYGMQTRALVVEDLRMRIMDQLQAVSLRFFATTQTGELINTLTNELARVSHSIQVIMTVISSSFLLLVYASLMVLISWQMSIVVLVFFLMLSLGLTHLIRLTRQSGEKVTLANGAFTSVASEFIGGIRTVMAFGTQAFERKRLLEATNRLAAAIIESSRRALMVGPLSQAVVSTVLVLIIVVATQFYVLPGRLDIAYLLTFLFALLRLLPQVQQINNQRGQWAVLRASISNVASILRRDDKPYLKDGIRKAPTMQQGFVFEGVSFTYDPGERVLKDINMTIACGKTTALVGASGAGKSTLVDLIPRFYDPTDGRILYDGVDLRAFDVASLRRKMAVVSQDTFIFNDTVQANIAYGMPDVTLERVVAAAEQANALEFIYQLPEGFNTILGDRGVRLSGGQRQRIAIARALLSDPEILILDEATSALDSISEQLVQQSLERLMRGRTVVAIAHRLSTIEHADLVVVLEDGRIVERGSYDDLLAQKGQLWRYHRLQFNAA